MEKLKIGLLPMYLELYDRVWPHLRIKIDEFHDMIADEFKKIGAEVVKAPVCRLKNEFEEAVRLFEREQTDAIVTLHLAYSPSMESAAPLISTKLPLIILDTTSVHDFSSAGEEEIMYNHGIHGVQDLCSVLKRNGRAFLIEAGHWQESDVLARVISDVRAARMAGALRTARVGIFGSPFHGMGDFFVTEDALRNDMGIDIVRFDGNIIKELNDKLTETEIYDEIAFDNANYIIDGISGELHFKAEIACLLLRKWIEKERLTAFTINFLDVDPASGLGCMPFLEASKAMTRGIGYAGEGDVLTSAFVGALMSVFPETAFTEMFCPDWLNDRIFLSHMGEMNTALSAGIPRLKIKEFPFTDASDTVTAYGRYRSGDAVLADLAPGPGGRFSLIITKGTMLAPVSEDRMVNSVHGWFKPERGISDFLEEYSRAGGTHHLALVYGGRVDEITKFGEMMAWDTIKI